MANIFQNISLTRKGQEKSFQWYQAQVRKLGKVNESQLLKETQGVSSIQTGNMYLFAYSPKYKEVLPYYDTFPLVLPFRRVNEGFLGINLHYLPYLARFKILESLVDYATDDRYDEKTKLNISWRLLESSSQLEPMRACVKHYLYSNVSTRFIKINYPDWVIASQLPVENFQKKSKEEVWRETRKKY